MYSEIPQGTDPENEQSFPHLLFKSLLSFEIITHLLFSMSRFAFMLVILIMCSLLSKYSCPSALATFYIHIKDLFNKKTSTHKKINKRKIKKDSPLHSNISSNQNWGHICIYYFPDMTCRQSFLIMFYRQCSSLSISFALETEN